MLWKKSHREKSNILLKYVIDRTAAPDKKDLKEINEKIGKIDTFLCKLLEMRSYKVEFVDNIRKGVSLFYFYKKQRGKIYCFKIKNGKIKKIEITSIR